MYEYPYGRIPYGSPSPYPPIHMRKNFLVLVVALFGFFLNGNSLFAENNDKNDEPVGYLAAYMTGDDERHMYYALSTDGLIFNKLLNDGKPIIGASFDDKLIRDPMILKDKNGVYHLIATVSWKNRPFTVWDSKDLVTWENERLVDAAPENASLTWAPELGYDRENDQYFAYWTGSVNNDWGTACIRYATTKDFIKFSEPKILVKEDRGGILDANIIYADGKYHMVYRFFGTWMRTSDHALGPYENARIISKEDTEGPFIFPLNKKDAEKFDAKYGICWDYFGNSAGYGVEVTNDFKTWRKLTNEGHPIYNKNVFFPPKIRHGSIIPLAQKEIDLLLKSFPVKELEAPTTEPDHSKKRNPAVVETHRMEHEWWQKRHDEKIREMNATKPEIFFVGDSITHGWEHAGKDVWDKYYKNRNAINLGFGGDETQHILWRLARAPWKEANPKLAIILSGTNNIGDPDQTPEQIAAGIMRNADPFLQRFKDVRVLVLSVFPRAKEKDDPLRKRVDAVNEALSKLTENKKNVTLLDLGSVFLKEDGTVNAELMPDYLHPNEKGYAAWAEAMEPTVERLLGQENPATVRTNALDVDWWKKRYEQTLKDFKNGDGKLIFLGDSITQGWGGAKDVWDRYFLEYDPVNLGISGNQVGHVLWQLEDENLNIKKASPKLVVLTIGTNNLWQPHTPRQISEGIKECVLKIREFFPAAKILVLAVPPTQEKADHEIRVKANRINEEIPKVLSDMNDVEFLDVNDRFLDENGVLSKEVAPDQVHLSRKGYEIWAESIAPTIERLMK